MQNSLDGMKIFPGLRDYDILPENLKKYVEFIEIQTGIPVSIVSVGPDRKATIFR